MNMIKCNYFIRSYTSRPSLLPLSGSLSKYTKNIGNINIGSNAHINAPSTTTRHNFKTNLNKWLPKRSGLITTKIGMAPFFDQTTGRRTAATILSMNNVEVMMNRTPELNGYWANQIGYGNKQPQHVPRPLLGHFSNVNVNPKEYVAEFRVPNESGLLKPGTLLKPSFFKVNQYIDIKSVSKGKGFAGVMKRHNFKGQRASHGTSLTHRHGGSYGQNQDPGRILPGKKMPGRMGGNNVTIQNSMILKVDDINSVIWVKGSVPGPKGSYVRIQDAIKKS